MSADAIVYVNSPTLYIELPPVLTLGQGLPRGQREGQSEQPASLKCGHDTRDTQNSKATVSDIQEHTVFVRDRHPKVVTACTMKTKGGESWAGWRGILEF